MEQINSDRDPVLWELARKRSSFKSHLVAYILVNLLLWGIWYFTGQKGNDRLPWPSWTTLGWGIGLSFHFASAYLFPGLNSTEREYQKLKNKHTK